MKKIQQLDQINAMILIVELLNDRNRGTEDENLYYKALNLLKRTKESIIYGA